MSCNFPLLAYQAFEKNAKGKRPIAFSPSGDTHPISLPCGQCIGCRLDKARSWAIRIHLESLEHEKTCFITLTYDEENIPYGQTLVPEDFTRFVKRLRKHCGPTHVRYFGVGEYGDTTQRPHYHAIIYGFDFPDRRIHVDRGDYTIDNSSVLTRLWPHGYSTVQNNSIEAAAYVSKYVVKKITGKKEKEHYEWIDDQTGEVHQRHPEFSRMSRMPGIGHDWLKKYYSDLYPKGFATDGKGNKFPPPEYFNKLYEKWFPDDADKLRNLRQEEVFKRYSEQNYERMKAREKIQTQRTKLRGGSI